MQKLPREKEGRNAEEKKRIKGSKRKITAGGKEKIQR
jgi:hypothetical protein